MRIVFIGAVEFSYVALQEILRSRGEVVGVCTKGCAGPNSDYRDLTPLCEEHGIPYLLTQDVNSCRALEWIGSLRPDYIFCLGWSSLLKRKLLDMPERGVVGFHPAALPHNRGRHPIVWALALGLEQTASTFFFMDEGADTGDILDQSFIQIDYSDDAGSLYKKVTETAVEQLRRFLPKLEDGQLQSTPQDPYAGNSWRKRHKADGCIDWRMSSSSIYNLVRALARPYAGAHFVWGDQEIKLWRAREVAGYPENIEPGRVVDYVAGAPVIKCGEGALALLETEDEFKPDRGGYL